MVIDTTDDTVFFEVALPSGMPCPGTPAIAEGEVGLRIAAPREVRVAEGMVIPICAVAQFSGAVRDALPSRLWAHTVIVVQDGRGRLLASSTLDDPTPIEGEREPKPMPPERPPEKGAVRQAEAPDDDPPPMVTPPPDVSAPSRSGADEDVPEVMVEWSTEYDNFDLLKVVEVPTRPGAELLVFLTYGSFQSNVVRIRLVRASD